MFFKKSDKKINFAAPKYTEDEIKNARIIVLGACCKKSAETFANVNDAVTEMELKDTVLNLGDPIEIAKFGVMQTPALVISGKVVSYGKLISKDDAKKFIETAGIKNE